VGSLGPHWLEEYIESFLSFIPFVPFVSSLHVIK